MREPWWTEFDAWCMVRGIDVMALPMDQVGALAEYWASGGTDVEVVS